MYELYHSRREKKLEIKPSKNKPFKEDCVINEVATYNDCFYLCSDRKLLKKKAEEIKSEWIEEAEKELEQLKEIKIKNKY